MGNGVDDFLWLILKMEVKYVLIGFNDIISEKCNYSNDFSESSLQSPMVKT